MCQNHSDGNKNEKIITKDRTKRAKLHPMKMYFDNITVESASKHLALSVVSSLFSYVAP